ncbi:hypothetical protein J4H86_04630 [Spiractinospora alimapuensis]|uniref:hypothetical protein n=1 Tax=Spiractinospora alimapuensis TaxID=2820884 RepID=UPI001F1EA63A|nr:hypothetical protein [Spiractinospora alimapuensis]QVQ53085.1 hypothetical protein J4H86_04630 [Spiractinospora alimapuensis]
MSTAESTESTSLRRENARRREPGRGGRPRVWFVAAIVVGLAVLGVGGWLAWTFLQGGDDERLPADAGVYSNSSVSETLVDREVDPRELTEPELFERGGEELSSQGLTFTLEEGEILDDCAPAVWGVRPEDALGSADCTQVARGAYTADDHIAMVTVFNLTDVASAEVMAASLEPGGSENDGFVTVMDNEAVADLGTGYSSAEITVQGHYLMVTWVQERSSTDPESHDSLSQPLRTLSNFEMPLFRRLLEHDHDDAEDEGDAEAAEGAENPEAEAEDVPAE